MNEKVNEEIEHLDGIRKLITDVEDLDQLINLMESIKVKKN